MDRRTYKGHAFFAYAANYLIDTDHGVIVDVEATRAIRQAEVGAASRLHDARADGDPLWHKARLPDRRQRLRFGGQLGMAGQSRKTLPCTSRSSTSPTETDGTFSRADFAFDAERDRYTCPAGKDHWSGSGAPTQPHEAASRPRAQGSTAPANWIATPADSNHSAARKRSCPQDPAGSARRRPRRGSQCTPQRRNTWRPVAGGRKSRCYSHISSESFVWPVCV